MKKPLIMSLAYIFLTYFILYTYFVGFNNTVIFLPQPRFTSDSRLEEVIALIHTRPKLHNYTPATMTLYDLSQILWAAQGITDPVLMFRASPSAGALYPIEIFIFIDEGAIQGLDAGIYHFDPKTHSIKLVRLGNFISKLELSVYNFRNCRVVLTINAVYERTARKYGLRATRYVHLEVGHIAQNVHLQALNLNLTPIFTLTFNKSLVKELTGLGEPLMAITFLKREFEPCAIFPSYVEVNEMSVEEVIVRRRSVRKYSEGNVTLNQLLQLLWASTHVNIGVQLASSINSSCDVSSIIYVAVGNIIGLNQGVYRYDPKTSELLLISREDVRGSLYEACYAVGEYTSEWVKEGNACIIVAAQIFGNKDLLFISMVESGAVAQNIHLQAVALKLGSVTVGGFDDEGIAKAVGLPAGYMPLHVIPIGPKPEIGG